MGDRVTPGPGWRPSDFDRWIAPHDVGIVRAIEFGLLDVQWPDGHATQDPTELILFDATIRPVTTKKRMYDLLMAGGFGNRIRSWDSLEEVLADPHYRGQVSIRSRETSNPVRLYHVPFEELADQVAALPEAATRAGLTFWETPPDEKRTIQGEITRRAGGLYLFYSYVRKPMRYALEEDGCEATGLEAKLLLQQHLTPTDYDELMELLDTYEDHVIEFSAFSIYVGTIPGRKLAVWECRQY